MTRKWTLAALPLLLAGLAMPAQAQISADIHLGPPQRSWGHEIPVVTYSQERFGPWRASYRHWRPVILYYANGRYYAHQIRGARRVEVYRSHNEYFLPPHEPGWNHLDRRYNYRYAPNDEDYNRPPPPRPPQGGH
jgi:hypothetical protein